MNSLRREEGSSSSSPNLHFMKVDKSSSFSSANRPELSVDQSMADDLAMLGEGMEGVSSEKLHGLSFEQVFLIYKFLETPMQILIDGMKCRSEEQLKKYFRQVAKQLHPDKNCHPKAKEAFQKIQKAFEDASKFLSSNKGPLRGPSSFCPANPTTSTSYFQYGAGSF
mmetsp:Transcript_3524/g.6023  ORF Transcript_3524/g.6023 Transcript_3524/m.6023 type:complete len:167 (+) Transcript_3524:405-905(+)